MKSTRKGSIKIAVIVIVLIYVIALSVVNVQYDYCRCTYRVRLAGYYGRGGLTCTGSGCGDGEIKPATPFDKFVKTILFK